MDEMSAGQLVLLRTAFAASILLIIAFFMGYRFRPKQIGWKPFLLGILDPGLSSLIWCTSLTLLSASNTILILALMPFSQSILGRIVFKEPLQASTLYGAGLAILGIGLFISGEEFNGMQSIWGNLLLMGVFGLMMASQLLTRSIMQKEIPAIQVTTAQIIMASVTMLVFVLVTGQTLLPESISSVTGSLLVYLIFSMAIPFFLYNQALKEMPVGMASLMLVLIIPFGFMFAAFFLGEEITMIKTSGAIFVMIGVALPHLPKARKLSVNV